ncbi:hypothetical protein B0T12DRAFT_497669 [Alternaria alternata]|nr:hypothetical protein B0T12DRAFT_497669 [Alternaria alternata]
MVGLNMLSGTAFSRERSPPELGMDYVDYIKSRERLAALEVNHMPDFWSMKNVDLQKAMKVLKLVGNGNKAFMVDKLEHHSRKMRWRHQKQLWDQAQSFIRERPELMLTSKVKSEPSRKCFMDLPPEIRDMIYELALFDPPYITPNSVTGRGAGDDHHSAGVLKITGKITGDAGRFSPVRSWDYTLMHLAELRVDRTISVLHVVGALNKQIRQEVQGFFWSHTRVQLQFGQPGPLFFGIYRIATDDQHQNYRAMIKLLGECSMLGSADRNAIRGFFLRDQPLNSPSVKSLVDVLGKTPTLRSVQLHMMFSRNGKFHCFDHDDMFAKFTFSGAREALLVQELRKRVTACPRHQDARFEVISTRKKTLDYEEWKKLTPRDSGIW